MTPPARRARLAAALAVGLAWGGYCYWNLWVRAWHAADFTQTWLAARALLAGADPYSVRPTVGPNLLGWYYPLPAAALGLAVAWLPVRLAGAAFFAASVAAAAYLLTRESWTRLWVFAGPSIYYAASNVQFGAFVLAATLAPGAWRGWLVVKPTVGLAGVAYGPTWREAGVTAAAGAALLVGGLLVDPDWPRRWYELAGGSPFARTVVATLPLGPLLLLAALRWRRPEARLLLAMACVPHTLFWHDDLLLWLAVRTRREALWLTVLTWAGFTLWHVREFTQRPDRPLALPTGEPWLVAFLYVPVLVMVLRRPNEGAVPAWLGRGWRWRGRRLGGDAEGGPATR